MRPSTRSSARTCERTQRRAIFHVKLFLSADGYPMVVDSRRAQRFLSSDLGPIEKGVGPTGPTTRTFDESGARAPMSILTGCMSFRLPLAATVHPPPRATGEQQAMRDEGVDPDTD